jgi:hypothetical protein
MASRTGSPRAPAACRKLALLEGGRLSVWERTYTHDGDILDSDHFEKCKFRIWYRYVLWKCLWARGFASPKIVKGNENQFDDE